MFGNRYVVSGINARGDVVGRTDFTSGADGFLRTAKGQVTIIDFPGALVTNANGINAQGQIVGNYQLNCCGFNAHGFIYDNGQFTTVDVPGARDTFPLSINVHGVIAGVIRDTTGHNHGFLDDHGIFTTIAFQAPLQQP